ncbi:solute carrier family 22 member 23-like isoform X2 [Betta splendens]|nr:solute carrier family 22 member 23-like isoform X2 [Betta splendens]
MLVFGLTVAFSVNVPMFSTLRFFEGFCLAGIVLSLYVLRIELCLPGWRFSVTMVASFVMLGGQLLMPGVAYLCRDWQVLQAVIICPLLLMLSYIWLFPESLRWLLATQQYCRSKWIVGHIVKKNQMRNMELDTELQRALQKRPKKTCIVKMVGTRNLWKNIVVLCVNSLTGYGIHHCFARSLRDPEAEDTTMFRSFYADYYTMAAIAVASCLALCPAVGLMGRRGGLLLFMIITALASLLQLGLLNLLGKYSGHLNIDSSGTLNTNFSIAFSIIGMFSSHAVSNLSIFFCAEITPTVIRGGGLGLVLASAGFGMLTAPIMELHNQKGYFLHHIIFACCTLICIICILLLPEMRDQPLPETLADVEVYSRPPLLSQRRAEQGFLLTRSESSRVYTRVQGTPLHEAAATAVSTMDSTASSAVDLTAPSVGDASAPALTEARSAEPEAKGPNGHSASAPSTVPITTLGKDGVIHLSTENLLSSTPLHAASCNTDPLLTSAEVLPASALDHVEPQMDSVPPETTDTGASPAAESAVAPVSSADSPAPPVPPVPASLLICTTPVIEPQPSTVLESPNPASNDTDAMAPKREPPPAEQPRAAIAHDSPPSSPASPSAATVSPSADSGLVPSEDSPGPPAIADADAAPGGSTAPPAIDTAHGSDPEPAPLTVADIAPHRAAFLVLEAVPPFKTDSPTPPSIVDCTISSPIDSGVLYARDGTGTASSTVNGVASS